MRAGRLRHRVTLQSPTGSQNELGERATTWCDEVANWPAAVEPLKVSEVFAAAQNHGSTTHKIHIRYDSTIAGVDGSWRVTFGTRIFTLDGPPRNFDEKNRTLELLCTEGLRQE
jgi:SPP1 family predicted phage head-tail adaptor